MHPNKIILHHSLTKDNETVSWDSIRTYHTSYRYNDKIITPTEAYVLKREGKKVIDPWSKIGYNIGVELINNHYEILMGRMLNESGAHTSGYNSNSIGICFVGNYDIIEVPQPMWKLGLELVHSLCDILEIPVGSVYGHRDFASYKTCPGKLFDVSQFRKDLLSNF